MDKIKKAYIDSRYKTNDSVNNSGFKIEIKESLDLGENIVPMIYQFHILGILLKIITISLILKPRIQIYR